MAYRYLSRELSDWEVCEAYKLWKWNKVPLTQLAPRYGISDTGLKRVFARLEQRARERGMVVT